MMPHAKLMHSGGGFRCEHLEKNLTLGLGLDGSAVLHLPGPLPTGWLVSMLDQLFIAAPKLTGIALPYTEWREEPQAQALFALANGDYLPRELFYQFPLWRIAAPNQSSGQMQYDAERDICFPQRPARPHGEVYRRFDPNIKRILSFRLPDIGRDAEQFTRWMNSPRIDAFWEMSGPLEVQTAYLQRQLDSSYCYPLLGCFDDQPFGYFEVYWAAEDRIGRHYRWQPFDRGLHMLVGEEHWRGAQYIRSWLRGLTHYLYLDEPRTTRVVAEPRADNQRLFRHLPAAGYHTLKEFDFPHKRSRLIVNQRTDFFREGAV
ncbi:GNAT family N-acetyltransferase [Yersinia aldovae]|uniref:Siderophore biosynthesis protein IucB n=1 Tax=Yersinia aldovae TaxID=29483 RepID=A0A0T9UN09_YERAL|nr:GNAT family N-acetyltransferase [Yersinia aldovae]CNK50797.1 putative siderophore biosynthesis protein IucB [Yersinia aldovae]CNL55075.1 putative siderophore biosynthesis protein IucB [Yersinia aldovae]